MSKEQKIDEYIRSKCIEANPSILDLVFGCEILLQDDGTFGKKNICLFEYEDPLGVLHCRDKTSMGYWQLEKHRGITIIGRPLQLSDILMAIHSKRKSYKIFSMASNGYMFYENESIDVFDKKHFIYTQWNLSLPYSSQTLEVKEFVAELLGYKDK